ncbi:MAG: alpha/beta fold hydrolase [Chloroflexi bacterium]|nr:alpha/beta fold hydrolase [Chloroflexota bacterium]
MKAVTSQGHLIKLSDIQVHYQVAGSGPPLVLLHGLGGSHVSWRKNIEALAQSHRVYVPDLPGHGYSDKPKIRYTLAFGVNFLRDFLQTQRIERASLVGASTGGLVALEFALSYPSKVDKLVVVDSAGLGRELHWMLRLLSLPLVGEILARPRRSGVRWLLKTMFYNPDLVSEELVEAIYQMRRQPEAKQALLRSLREGASLTGQRSHILALERLPQIQSPALIVWGEHDRLMPVAHAYRAHSLIPNSQLHIFPDCGHAPYLERPEEFNQVVLDFLRNGGGN